MTVSTGEIDPRLEFGPPPEPCCVLGRPYFEPYGRLLRAALNGRCSQDRAMSMLTEIAAHLLHCHDATGPDIPACPGCRRFDGPPAPDHTVQVSVGTVPPPMSPDDWAEERRLHQIAHTVVMGGPLQLGR
ncbi:hypothetical protein [Streptomyces sp. NPDC088739]|uniref:hypothetical protein n=1 Tax=Streptomyces sp. NPDC088739 TaxID=3365882 RepID=UPI0037F125E3